MEMKINKDNYELFFMNYFDGLLKPEEIDALMLFLKNNPLLEDEFYSFENTAIPENQMPGLGNKNFLKKSVSDKPQIKHENIDEFLIAYIENDLNEKDIDRLMAFLKINPQYIDDLETYKKTISIPDTQIKFADKKSLKHKTAAKQFKIRYIYYATASAAAVVLFLFNIFFSDNVLENNDGLRLQNNRKVLEAGITLPFNRTPNNDNKTDDDIAFYNEKEKFLNNVAKSNGENLQKISHLETAYLPTSINQHNIDAQLRTEYSEMYSYIKISEQRLSTDDYSNILPEKPKESFVQYAFNKIFTGTNSSDTDSEQTNPTDVWQIVDIGTYGINALAKNKVVEVNRSIIQDEKVKTEFALGGNVLFSRTRSGK